MSDKDHRRCRLALVLLCVGWVAGCGGESEGVARPFAPPPTPTLSLRVVGSVELGSGLISPYKLLDVPERPDRLFVVTGRGETFSEGMLHVVDPGTLADLSQPLDIGLNGSDATVVSVNRLVVVSRGGRRASLVDIDAWRVLSEFALDFEAGAIDGLSGNQVIVTSAVDGNVLVLATDNDRLVERQRSRLDTFAYDVVSDPDSQLVYVIQPLRGVEVLNASDLSRRQLIRLTGEPGRGGAIWRDFLVASNRDGYLHFIDRTTFQVQTLDLAAELGLQRSELPVRGIDPGQVRALDERTLLVVNGRQPSLLLELDEGSTPPIRMLARAPGGQSAVFFPGGRTLLVAQPSENRVAVARVPDSPVRGTSLAAQLRVTGKELVGWAPMLDGSRTVAVQDSMGSLHVVDDAGKLVASMSAPAGQRWRQPFTPTEGGFAVNGLANGSPSLIIVDSAGMPQRTVPLGPSSIFSMAAAGGTIAAVSRLTRQVQFVTLADGSSRLVTLARDRPRLALALGTNWIVAHDTNPDIGITLLRDDGTERFEPFDDWFSGLVAIDPSRALTASFLGSVAIVDDSGRLSQVRRLGIPNVSSAAGGTVGTAWLTSESLGFSHRIRDDGSGIEGRVDHPGVRGVMAFPGNAALAVISARSVSAATD